MSFVKLATFRSVLIALTIALPVSLTGFVSAQTVQPRLTRPINDANLTRLGGMVHPLANAANDRGRASDDTRLDRIQLVLKRSDEQESQLKQLLTDMHTPGSPSYHHWLTPDQFGAQFGPSDADIQTLGTWLREKGFTVGTLTPGRQILEISGTASTFRSAFHSDIHRYVVNGESHFANSSDPEIPSALAPVLGGFATLNNFRIKPNSHLLGRAAYNTATHTAKGDWTIDNSKGGQDLVLSPKDYAVQYDIPNGLNAAATPTVTGSGQTIVVINDSNINVYLVNQFRSLFGLPANPPQIIVDGNDPGIDGVNNPDGPNGDSVEAYLDVEWAGAVAPNATVALVIGGNTNLESGLFLALEHAIYSNVAPIMSLSFGTCEFALGSSNQFLASLYQQAAAQGITILVSSGDSGSAGCDDDNSQTYATNGQAVNGFASTPYNVAVGGTDFYYSSYNSGSTALNAQLGTYWNLTSSNSAATTSIKGVIPEQPWNNSQFGLNIINSYATTGVTNIVGAGGGPSDCGIPTISATTGAVTACTPYAKPSWQTGFGDSVRDTPDVSLFASNGTNHSYYPLCAVDGDCQPVSSGSEVQISGVGGTSASTPAFAGFMAMVNQKYGRQGQANNVLYPLAKQFPAAFHDVTVGSNAVPCQLQARSTTCIATNVPSPAGEGVVGSAGVVQYNASTGYDLASGLGTIDANVMLTNWNKITFQPSTTQLTPSQTTFAHGTSINVNGTVTGTGTPTGAVTLMTDSNELSQQSQVAMALNSSGAFSQTGINYLPGGTYNIWGQYGGDGVNAASTSAKAKITVSPENSGVFFLVTTPTNQGITILTSPSSPSYKTQIPYGTNLTLFGLVAPSSQLAAFENCEVGNGTCPTFTSPTGTVTFLDSVNGASASLVNSAVINSEADAEFTYATGVGTHSITAQYSGDSSYGPSSYPDATSSATAQTFTVVKATPQLGLEIDSKFAGAQITNGQPTILHVFLLNPYSAPLPVVAPSGTVTLTGAPLTTPITLTMVQASNGTGTSGVASTPINLTATPGTYQITVSYAGDANYNAYSQQVSVTVVAAASGLTSTTIASVSATSTSASAAVKLNVTVNGQTGSAAPTGTLSLYSSVFGIGTYTLPTVTSGSSVSTSITLDSTLIQGNNQISIWYSGDSTYLPSVAAVNVLNSKADFSLIPATSTIGVPTSGISTDVISLGSINAFSGAVNLTCSAPTGITCSMSPTSATLTSGGVGSSTLNINTSGVSVSGSYPILVTASDAATGTIVHTLNIAANVAGASTGFGLTSSGSSTITLANPGSTGTATITLTSPLSFTGSVTLSCAVTSSPASAAHLPTCSITSPVNVVSGSSATATLTVNTTASAAVQNAPLQQYFRIGGGAVLAMLIFLGVPRRRAWSSLLGALLLSVALMLGISGCSSGSGSSGTSTTSAPAVTNTGTTFGSYTITVTGTSGSNTSTTAVTVVVN